MRSEKLLSAITGLMVTVVLVMPTIVNACAVCGLGPNDNAGHAFNTSVLFMMAVPYTTVIVIGGAVYLAWRKAQRRNAFSMSGHKN